MRWILPLLLAAFPLSAANFIYMDQDQAKAKQSAEKSGQGDVQVGPAIREAEGRPYRKPQAGSRVPGIFPVYEEGGNWLLVIRNAKNRRVPGTNSRFLVIGSRGVGVFRPARSTRTKNAACIGHKPVGTPALLLSASTARSRKRVGTPIIAILLKAGATLDPAQALLRPLPNSVSEETYQLLGDSIRRSIIQDVGAGTFRLAPNDEGARLFASHPDPEKVLMKIDFASGVMVRGLKQASLVVEGAQISATPRRCLHIFEEANPLGACAEMPYELMAETSLLSFVAYYPNPRGRPFVLAYTAAEPHWGHERWGFQVTGEGPQLFLRDALDPRCREGF